VTYKEGKFITPVVPEAPKTVENKGSGQTKKRKGAA
jgi:hypothetical protein